MEVIVKKNYEEMSKAAATLFAAEIMENPKDNPWYGNRIYTGWFVQRAC